MGTPSLWCEISLDCNRWPADASKFVDRLEIALQRGSNHPLSIGANLSHTPEPLRRSVLALLANHSQRWRHFDLQSDDFSDLEDIAHIEGKLDCLQSLSLKSPNQWMDSIDIFKTAPRLTEVSFAVYDPRCYPRLPWNQLRSYTCDCYYTPTMNHPTSLNVLPHLSHPDAAFEFRGFFAYWPELSLEPPVTSNIASFLVEMEALPSAQAARDVLTQIFRLLTLPNLRELRCFSTPDRSVPRFPILWPLQGFEALALRSSFNDTLRVLDIRHITITEEELVVSLAYLASLERLVIADQREIFGARDHILVGDTLLQRLTLTPDHIQARLIPRLKQFDCTSFFKFDPQVYFDFVASRIVPGTIPFHSILRYFARLAWERDVPTPEFDSVIRQKLLATDGLQFELEKEIKDSYIQRR
ncbi:hypothetical protein C8R43DRAFT_1237068 [Mycena crocata]|nr:hypothetical protein C8R43DRAFT_1237068 [Mycena crocata]